MGVFGARRLIGTFATAAAAIAVLSSCRTTPEASSPEPPAPEPTAVARQYWIGTVTYVTELDGVQMRDGTIVTGEATITWIFDDYPLHPGGATDAHLRMALDLSRVRDCRTTRTVVDVDTTVSAGRIVGRDSQDLGYVRPASMDIRHHNEIGTLRTESSSCDPPSSTATERPYVTMPPHLDLMVGFPLGDLLELRRGDVITDRFAKIWVTRVRPVLLPLAGEISLGVPVANKRIPLGLWETVTEQWILSQSIRDTTRQMRCILRYFGQDLGLECVSILLRLPPMCDVLVPGHVGRCLRGGEASLRCIAQMGVFMGHRVADSELVGRSAPIDTESDVATVVGASLGHSAPGALGTPVMSARGGS